MDGEFPGVSLSENGWLEDQLSECELLEEGPSGNKSSDAESDCHSDGDEGYDTEPGAQRHGTLDADDAPVMPDVLQELIDRVEHDPE